jgi:hypothetical protein
VFLRDDLSVIDRFSAVVLAVALLFAAGACRDGDEKDSAFCREVRNSVTRLEQTYATLAESAMGGGMGAGQTDVGQASTDYTAAVDAVIEALGSAPAEIKADADAAVEGLRQQVASVAEVQPGSPPAPFPAERQAAASQVDSYLQTNCEFSGSLTPR